MAPKIKQKKTRSADVSDKAISDPRFSNIHTDPRFRLPSRKNTRVQLDNRFARILKDDEFAKKSSVDRYGRKIAKGQGRKELERFYHVDDDDEGEEKNEIDGDAAGADDDEDVRKELARVERTYDPAREGGFSESSSDDDEESDSEEEDEELDAAEVAEIDAGADDDGAEKVPMGNPSPRIAVVNLDWDNIRAVDLMAVGSSFCPPSGRILSVTVYPSEFGKERMEREEQEGPPAELFASSSSKRVNDDDSHDDGAASDSDSDSDEKIKRSLLAQSTADAPEVNTRALRAYQLSRLRYYYAVIICDSIATASTLYNEMDGREYLSTANFFDLRFVPDSVSFDNPVTDRPRDKCDKVPDGYRPSEFVTEALTHSKVRLTWDEEDPGRKEVQKRAFSRQEVDENDLKAYVGSSSSEDEDDDEADADNADTQNGVGQAAPKPSKAELARQKMRAALGLSINPAAKKKSASHHEGDKTADKPVGDMQITFTAGLSSAPARTSVFDNKPEDVIEETTRERYIRKERERKARRKAKSQVSRTGSDGSSDEAVAAAAPATTKPAENGTEKEREEEEDPFNDPFFTDPASANAAAKKAAKAAKRAASAVEAEAAEKKKRREREELELLMVGEDGADLAGRGFDMAAIRKAEKAAAKAGKKGKKKRGRELGGQKEGEGGKEDDFEIDVADPRFRGVFERNEFALDPSNPRFSGTRGMKALLEEGRRKRKGREGDDGGDEGGGGGGVVKGNGKKGDAVDRELEDLVKKVKRRKAA